MTAFGGIFLLWFIKTAGCDVVYTDYIRIVAEYLPDVTDPSKFFVPDILTRIPITFLQRLINVKLFAYSVTFDRVCAAAGLWGCALVIAFYMRKERLSALWFVPIVAVIFSLNKWEIILNGTAWAHVAAFALFFLNYYLLDRYYGRQRPEGGNFASGLGARLHDGGGNAGSNVGSNIVSGEESRPLKSSLYVLPCIMLLFAGEYIASYAAIMLAAYGFCFFMKKRSGDTAAEGIYLRGFLCTLAAIGLYLLSRHFAVWEHAGTTDMGLFEVIAEDPLFIPRLFIKSFAGTVLGTEAINNFRGSGMPLSDNGVLLLGLLVIAAYIFAIVLYIRHRIWKRTLFPMILMLSGGFNHVLVTASRWIFLSESYGLSSRYGAQFMIGVIGILLTLAICVKDRDADGENRKMGFAKLTLSLLITLMFLFGNCFTTYLEMGVAPYREENYTKLQQVVFNDRDYEPEELADYLEWGKSEETMYKALEILEKKREAYAARKKAGA